MTLERWRPALGFMIVAFGAEQTTFFAMHCVCPVWVVVVPAGQLLQAIAPVVSE
jgi:hypothetical protein